MSLTETIVEGTLQSDGTLVLDEKPNLPPGRVTVVLRQETESALPTDDPFWQRMQAMWDLPNPLVHDGGVQTEAELRRMRDEWDEHQKEIERIQEDCRLARQAHGEANQ